MSKVCVVGSANLDMVVSVDRYPKPGETIFGNNFAQYPGGKGANQAVASAKLGVETIFIGKMGQDGFRDFLHTSMKSNGVDLDHSMESSSASTGTAMILVNSDAENEIIVIPGSNMELIPDEIQKRSDVIETSNILLCQLEIPTETVVSAFEIAAQSECITILNPAPGRKLPDQVFPMLDYITPNETELEILTGMSCDNLSDQEVAAGKLLAKGVKNVIVTLGDKGALWVCGNGVKHFQAPVVKAVDTTAAGDAFNGAFAAGLSNGLDVGKAIEFAISVASMSVTRHGAQTSMPSLKELESV